MNARFALKNDFLITFMDSIFSMGKAKPSRGKIKNTNFEDSDSNEDVVNVAKHTTPGIYIAELPDSAFSVIQVKTAVCAFIGYTEKGSNSPTKISSLIEYKNIFGGPSSDEIGEFEIDNDGIIISPIISSIPKFKMFYMLEMFFANGGKDCFIISIGDYSSNEVNNEAMLAGLELLNNEDLPTLILFPDAYSSISAEDSIELYRKALVQCADRKDRFLICDVQEVNNSISESAEIFRNLIGTENLKFGAAYFPSLKTILKYRYLEDKIKVKLTINKTLLGENIRSLVLKHTKDSISTDVNKAERSLFHTENGKYINQYQEIKKIINDQCIELPPSAAMAGLYNNVDGTQGVWRAPANISLNYVLSPKIEISNSQQEKLNVDITGISINAIRSFSGKGVMPWGARTMAGNDNEWRYISVRRFAIVLEKSIKKAMASFVHEPNDADTWSKIKMMTENYLTSLWREGALNGSKPEQAYFVKIGVGQTMSYQDVSEGNMNVEIGIAPVKPAEFIVLKLTQKMENS